MFKQLSFLPGVDGTFDQDGCLKSLLAKASNECDTLYSYDLSSATDRLPIDIQSDILDQFLPGIGPL